MAETFQVGDVVTLKAGKSPEMVVDKVMVPWERDPVEIPSVRCVWINEHSGEAEREAFYTMILKRATIDVDAYERVRQTLFSIDLKMNEIFTEMSHPQSGDGPLADLEILKGYLAVQRGIASPAPRAADDGKGNEFGGPIVEPPRVPGEVLVNAEGVVEPARPSIATNDEERCVARQYDRESRVADRCKYKALKGDCYCEEHSIPF